MSTLSQKASNVGTTEKEDTNSSSSHHQKLHDKRVAESDENDNVCDDEYKSRSKKPRSDDSKLNQSRLSGDLFSTTGNASVLEQNDTSKPTQSKPTQSKPTQSKPTQSKPTQSRPSCDLFSATGHSSVVEQKDSDNSGVSKQIGFEEDDGLSIFARQRQINKKARKRETLEEHEARYRNHCQVARHKRLMSYIDSDEDDAKFNSKERERKSVFDSDEEEIITAQNSRMSPLEDKKSSKDSVLNQEDTDCLKVINSSENMDTSNLTESVSNRNESVSKPTESVSKPTENVDSLCESRTSELPAKGWINAGATVKQERRDADSRVGRGVFSKTTGLDSTEDQEEEMHTDPTSPDTNSPEKDVKPQIKEEPEVKIWSKISF